MPEFLKELFGENSLTFEQFSEAVSNKGYKLADLSTGNYVGKKKHDDELANKDTAIEDLRAQIKTRDTDITNLKNQIAADGDKDTKLQELNTQLEKLQSDYDTAKKDYEARMGKQSYEFAVKEFANNQKFTSVAARKQFVADMVSENLKMKNGNIIGADDYLKAYKEEFADSFMPDKEPETEPNLEPDMKSYPTFVQPTAPSSAPEENPFTNAFNFTGIRPKE